RLGIETAISEAQRHADALTQIANERLVAVRLRSAQMMVDVRCDDRDADLPERKQKRRRIGAARHSDHHPPANAVGLEKAARGLLDHRSRLHSEGCGGSEGLPSLRF